ncbi:MAG TPA: hypothetical protein PKZ42_15635 [Syntrophales bacterium]|nr:hypothetical protein [Syntrophales bacterium]
MKNLGTDHWTCVPYHPRGWLFLIVFVFILASHPVWARVPFTQIPDYDSGWVAITADTAIILTHNLGGDADDYVVDMQYKDFIGDGVNQRHYGGADFGNKPPSGRNENDRVGAYWRTLTTSTITVYRRPEDVYASNIRIRILGQKHRSNATYLFSCC